MDHLPDTLDWSRLQSFVTVADTGSLSAAARHMRLSQPTLGRQIRALEQDLGVALFVRKPRGLALTEAGAALLEPARRMQDAARNLALAAAGRSEDLAGTVRITASAFVSLHILPGILAAMRQSAPEIQIELVASDSSQNLLFREADIALRMFRPEQLDVVTRFLGELELGLFGATDYLDRRGRPQCLDDIAGHDMIGYDTQDDILRGMREIGMTADRSLFQLRCDDNGVIWQMIRAGCGLGFAQVNVAATDPRVERVMPDLPLPRLPVWLTAHEAVRRTPRLRRVWDLLADGIAPWLADAAANGAGPLDRPTTRR
ncbi:LysR family transcriptional regulator [Tropicimonas sp. IMCC34043]|uniref:LysR family transcriptional regulator n=1 Tax=Tropicimonas sp. IMCC34043 TaxID=2248760 RepID=UPI000E231234|nr:LysR family transcriptional regulator [Tropicimonas sp. IMCC34043]